MCLHVPILDFQILSFTINLVPFLQLGSEWICNEKNHFSRKKSAPDVHEETQAAKGSLIQQHRRYLAELASDSAN